MARFQIVSPHEPAECFQAIDEIVSTSPDLGEAMLLGCHFGDHTGYAVIEASSEEEARRKLPTNLRKKARVVLVESVDIEEVLATHERTP